MKDFPTKANISGGNDTGASTGFGANEFNSIALENETAVTSTGQTLTTGQAADTKTDQLARALTIASQSGMVYEDSGAADSYVLTRIGSLVQPEAYYDGMRVIFKPDNANTGNTVVNISTLGSKKILTMADAEIAAGSLTTERYYELIYDSTLDSAAGAFALKPNEPRPATDTEVDNFTDVDAYVKPAQLSSLSGWESWQSPSFNTNWEAVTTSGKFGLQYRRSKDGDNIHLCGYFRRTGAGVDAFTLPSGYRPTAEIPMVIGWQSQTDKTYGYVEADGNVYANILITTVYFINEVIPIT